MGVSLCLRVPSFLGGVNGTFKGHRKPCSGVLKEDTHVKLVTRSLPSIWVLQV